MPVGRQRREGTLCTQPCVTGRRPLGAAAWRSGSLFSFEQGVLGHQQMATGQTGTGELPQCRGHSWKESSQLPRLRRAWSGPGPEAEGSSGSTPAARVVTSQGRSPPTWDSWVPRCCPDCPDLPPRVQRHTGGSEPAGAPRRRGRGGHGRSIAGLPPARCSPRKPHHFRLPCLSLCLLFPVGERGEGCHLRPHRAQCLHGRPQGDRAVPRSGGWARGAGRGGLFRLGAVSASTAPLLRLLRLLHRGGQVGLFLFNFNKIPEGR